MKKRTKNIGEIRRGTRTDENRRKSETQLNLDRVEQMVNGPPEPHITADPAPMDLLAASLESQ